MLRFKITGNTELAKALQGLPAAVSKNIAMQAMEKAVEPLVAEARARSHRSIRSGALFRSIGFAVRQYKKGRVTFGVIGPRHGFRTTLPDGTTADPTRYAHLVEYGHAIEGDAAGWVEAQPFMRPAWDEKKAKVLEILSKLLGQGIEEQAAKIAGRRARAASRARAQAVALGAPVI